MQLRLLGILLAIILSVQLQAQIGGRYTYEFLNLSPSARISGLGGNLITVVDDDVNLAFQNPGLLNSSMHQQIAFSHNFFLGDIQHGYAAYGHYVDQWKTTFHTGIQYVDYGEFDQTNVLGEREGTFKAAEYAFTVGAAYPFYDRLTIGANMKLVSSQLAGFNSFGISTDIAGVYTDTASNFVATVVFRNVGTQISTFREDNFEPIPFEIQVGISKRLTYLPFRFSIIYRNLERWDILYDDPNAEEDTFFLGEETSDDSETGQFFDTFFRHFVFNGEFLFGKRENFRLRVGYNHLQRRELLVDNFRGLSGFSFGAGIKINRFRIDYGRSVYHLAGGVNHLSISTNFKEFRK